MISNCKKNEDLPIVATGNVTEIGDTSATAKGDVSYEGGAEVTVRGICYSTKEEPTTADNKMASGIGMGEFTVKISGLSTATKYYVRAFATNEFGTSYGSVVSFTTKEKIIPITDIDGNVYQSVKIDQLEWMVPNLKTTRFNDGDDIPKVEDAASWTAVFGPAFCWYNNQEANKASYGALYNFYAVLSSKICPTGWRVATDNDWATLVTLMGGVDKAGTKLKESGTVNWNPPNTGAANDVGFTALPGGMRENDGAFTAMKQSGYWWSSTSASTYSAWYWQMKHDADSVIRKSNDMEAGYSVRCVRD